MSCLKRTVFLCAATWVQTPKCQTHLTLKHSNKAVVGCEICSSPIENEWGWTLHRTAISGSFSWGCKTSKGVFPVHCILYCFFYAKDMHGINLSARFTVESIKTELFTSFQYYLHNIYINTYLIKAVKIFLECNIDLVSLLLNPGKVQVIPFRDISLCCFSVFSVMLNIKKVQLSMPPAERRQSQG